MGAHPPEHSCPAPHQKSVSHPAALESDPVGADGGLVSEQPNPKTQKQTQTHDDRIVPSRVAYAHTTRNKRTASAQRARLFRNDWEA